MKARSLFARKHRRFVAISQGGLSTFKLQKPEDIAVLETRKDLPFDYVEGVRLEAHGLLLARGGHAFAAEGHHRFRAPRHEGLEVRTSAAAEHLFQGCGDVIFHCGRQGESDRVHAGVLRWCEQRRTSKPSFARRRPPGGILSL